MYLRYARLLRVAGPARHAHLDRVADLAVCDVLMPGRSHTHVMRMIITDQHHELARVFSGTGLEPKTAHDSVLTGDLSASLVSEHIGLHSVKTTAPSSGSPVCLSAALGFLSLRLRVVDYRLLKFHKRRVKPANWIANVKRRYKGTVHVVHLVLVIGQDSETTRESEARDW